MQRLRAFGAGESARHRATMAPGMRISSRTRWALGAVACALVGASVLLHRSADAPSATSRVAAGCDARPMPSAASPLAASDVVASSGIPERTDERARAAPRAEIAERPHALTRARLRRAAREARLRAK